MVSLNVANNPNLGSCGMEEIKKTTQQFHVKQLNIGSCRLDEVKFNQTVSVQSKLPEFKLAQQLSHYKHF